MTGFAPPSASRQGRAMRGQGRCPSACGLTPKYFGQKKLGTRANAMPEAAPNIVCAAGARFGQVA